MDFEIPPAVVDIADRTRRLIDEQAIPREPDGFDELGVAPQVRAELQRAARDAGVFAPSVARELGGLGLDWRGCAVVFEQAGRSLLGPQALNIAPPDEGNMHMLAAVANEEQKQRYLAPLAAADIRSCFSMTEPSPGAGSDAAGLLTTASRVAGGWCIEGHKWFTTGAIGADFAIVMARTRERITRGSGATMFLVGLDNPGMRVVRSVETTDHTTVGGHCEVVYDQCMVSDADVIGEVDEGYRYAQVRLAPARLTHCMRWLGIAQRAHEMAIRHAAERELFGSRLGDLGMAQAMIADSEIDLRASRLLVWHGAAALDAGSDARQESSVAKVFVSEAVGRVVDRAAQLHGGRGMSDATILSRLAGEVRPFRVYDGPSEVHRAVIARRLVKAARPVATV